MKAIVCKMVPMSDGLRLATDVWLPDGAGKFPVVLVRTPYHRAGGVRSYLKDYLPGGYAVAIQDCRGKYDSEGIFAPLEDEARDGQDTIAWIAEQRWCNGRIGMVGGSYLGFVQVPAADGGHEALRCIIPQVTSSSFFRHWARYDGCPALCNGLVWHLSHAVSRTKPPQDHFAWDELYGMSTLEEIFERIGYASRSLREVMEHDCYDEYWQRIDQFPSHARVRVPGWHMGGWFDHHLQGQVETYQRICRLGATTKAREGQRLLVGPWGHSTFGATGEPHCRYGDWDFGDVADVSIRRFEQRFLALHLKHEDDGLSEEPPVQVFLMGPNRWLNLDDWPPPEVEYQDWYLHSQGHADTKKGPGVLAQDTPDSEVPDSYVYDPRDPMPTWGGPVYQGIAERGPRDQRSIMSRSDFVYYRSAPLSRPLAVIGNVELDLWICSSAVDTDFIARLCVVEASGAVTCFSYGSLRCRYRESWDDPKPLEPDIPTLIHIQMGHTAYQFPSRSRVALTIVSSCFPRIVPHTNTMDKPFSGASPLVATQTVLHDDQHSSRLRLPVLEL